MTEEERDALLIRLDERSGATHEWITKHESLHREEKMSRWKWIAPLYGAVIAGLSKIIFWD